MTDTLSPTAQALLNSTRFLKVSEINNSLDCVQVTHAVYGWWFDDDLPIAPRNDSRCINEKHLLYVGASPERTTMAKRKHIDFLGRRFLNHCRGGVASSTLRYSVAALLQERMGFRVTRTRSGKPKMGREDELRLTNWMQEHATVSYVEHQRPWEIKYELISEGPALPLNIQKSTHPFRNQLSQYRKGLGRS